MTATATPLIELDREMLGLEERLRATSISARSIAEREEILGAADAVAATRRRVRAAAARETGASKTSEAIVLTIDGLEVDLEALTARVHGRLLDLTQTEFALLAKLASAPTRVFRKAELLQAVWGYPAGTQSRTVDTHAMRLRRKLGTGWVQTVRGVGYRLTNAEGIG